MLGISTGVIELRGDGTFHEWTIINQSPAGAGKIQTFDDAFFAMRQTTRKRDNFQFHNNVFSMSKPQSQVFAIRTNPPNSIPGVDEIEYSGEYPVSRLQIKDKNLVVKTELVAYSSYYVNDMKSSAKPAIGFTFNLENPTSDEVDLELLLNLPIHIERSYERTSSQNGVGGPPVKAKPVRVLDKENDVLCDDECRKGADCKSWTYYKTSRQCQIFNTVNLNAFNEDASSGLKGTWQFSKVDDNLACNSLVRDGNLGPNGNFSICGVNTEGVSISYGSSKNMADLWESFEKNGEFSETSSNNPDGAMIMKTNLRAGEKRMVTFIVSWYYPNRDFVNKIYGNYYQNLFTDSLHVAKEMRDSIPSLAANVSALHKTFLDSSLPEWLSDLLVNSLSHIRTAIWFKDGRWRQWEATDCVNIGEYL